jgi:hypothetical protein
VAAMVGVAFGCATGEHAASDHQGGGRTRRTPSSPVLAALIVDQVNGLTSDLLTLAGLGILLVRAASAVTMALQVLAG